MRRFEPRYFGCWDRAGHHVYTPQGTYAERYDPATFLERLDGLLPPADESQMEGAAKLYHFNGCTVLSFWDRTIDKRPGSSSTFLMPGKLAFGEMVELCEHNFPGIYRRFPFPIVIAP